MTTVLDGRSVGPLLRDWRQRRRRSQLDLALEVGVSARHLSFVETGRSRPSPELVLTLADHLAVPLRERNAFLLAAGYAPRYRQTALDDPTMDRVRTTLQRVLDTHQPYPGLVIDRVWNVVLANGAATDLAAGLPPDLVGPPLNVFRACLHPDGLARLTRNLSEWATTLVVYLNQLAVTTADPAVAALVEEVSAYPDVVALGDWRHAPPPEEPALLVPWQVELGGVELSFFTTLTVFGTPQDVTLSELAVELFYPADPATEAALRSD